MKVNNFWFRSSKMENAIEEIKKHGIVTLMKWHYDTWFNELLVDEDFKFNYESLHTANEKLSVDKASVFQRLLLEDHDVYPIGEYTRNITYSRPTNGNEDVVVVALGRIYLRMDKLEKFNTRISYDLCYNIIRENGTTTEPILYELNNEFDGLPEGDKDGIRCFFNRIDQALHIFTKLLNIDFLDGHYRGVLSSISGNEIDNLSIPLIYDGSMDKFNEKYEYDFKQLVKGLSGVLTEPSERLVKWTPEEEYQIIKNLAHHRVYLYNISIPFSPKSSSQREWMKLHDAKIIIDIPIFICMNNNGKKVLDYEVRIKYVFKNEQLKGVPKMCSPYSVKVVIESLYSDIEKSYDDCPISRLLHNEYSKGIIMLNEDIYSYINDTLAPTVNTAIRLMARRINSEEKASESIVR